MGLTFSPKHDRRYCRNLIKFSVTVVFVAAIVLYIGLPIWDVENALHPTKFAIGSVSPADLGLNYTDVALYTQDKLTLRGWYVPSTNHAAVILVHAFNGNRTGTIYHAALLARRGYGVLLYDTRTQGESDGEQYALGWEDHSDILAAVEYLSRRPDVDPDRIGVLGLSAGAKAALYAAAQTDAIAAVVAEGARWRTFEDLLGVAGLEDYPGIPAAWLSYQYAELVTGIRNPIPLIQAISHMKSTPIYLIAGRGDLTINQAYFDAAQVPITLWARDVTGHQIGAIFDEPEEYERRIIGFLDETLLRGQ
jgi:predicted alpha/beta hydrolase